MTDFAALRGAPLERALEALRACGLTPDVVFTQSPRRPTTGTARVLRVTDGGARVTAAYFPDTLAGEEARP